MIAYAGKNSGIPSGLLVGLTLTAALTIANLCFFSTSCGIAANRFQHQRCLRLIWLQHSRKRATHWAFFLIPLGDMFNRKKLMMVVYCILLLGVLATFLARIAFNEIGWNGVCILFFFS